MNSENRDKIVPIILSIVAVILFGLSIKSHLEHIKDSNEFKLSSEQRLESIRIIEKNEKWFDGYKQGQIDAIKGYINFELKKNDNGETLWEHSPKRGYNK